MCEPRRLVLLVCVLVCCGCGQKKSTDELVHDLKTGNEKDRLIAVRLLPQRKGDAEQVVPVLVEALRDHEGDIRWSAAIGLGNFGEQAAGAIPALKDALDDHDARVREAAGVALSRIDPKQFPEASSGAAK